MNYIVLDLEWNQSNTVREQEETALTFEIIEIGAIKLNEEFQLISEFSRLIKPQVYHEMHRITSKLVHMRMEELERGKPFPVVMQDFLDWIGEEECTFCTWGPLDLAELQKNMRYYDMEPLSDGPIAFWDVQKLFSIAFEDRKTRRALEWAVDYLQIEKDIPFHRAFSDAYYTAKVMEKIEDKSVFRYVSFDTFTPPQSRDREIKIQFDTYEKYISREFADKTEAFADKEVVASKCYLCHRNLRKKVKWFTSNGKNYYCIAYCDKHGFLKGKNRVRKTENGGVFVIKTTKFISEQDMEELLKKKNRAQEMRKKKSKH